jgi:hypothetical protein
MPDNAKQGGASCKRRRVRMNNGVPNQADVEHNKKCYDKNVFKDNPWMLEKKNIEITKELFPKKFKKVVKTKKNRKGPEESATKFKVGTKKKGNDGNMWKIVENKNGTKRWQKGKGKTLKNLK